MPLTSAMRDWIGVQEIARFDKMRDADNDLPAPWRVFPSYRPTSMGWRMGVGEAYMAYWNINYEDLRTNAKQKYRRKYRAPMYWYWAYWNLESPIIAILVAITGLLTWIPRIPLHLIYQICACPRVQIPD